MAEIHNRITTYQGQFTSTARREVTRHDLYLFVVLHDCGKEQTSSHAHEIYDTSYFFACLLHTPLVASTVICSTPLYIVQIQPESSLLMHPNYNIIRFSIGRIPLCMDPCTGSTSILPIRSILEWRLHVEHRVLRVRQDWGTKYCEPWEYEHTMTSRIWKTPLQHPHYKQYRQSFFCKYIRSIHGGHCRHDSCATDT